MKFNEQIIIMKIFSLTLYLIISTSPHDSSQIPQCAVRV